MNTKQRRRARAIRYISLFSGVECASLAVESLSWTPICFAEIEPFPCAVLAHRFPTVPNVGDMTQHNWSRYRGRCDVVVGGSPCQAFSVAGLRQSLGDARGNLTLSYVEAVNAIDPCFTVWENVPGVLST
jgi:DNA (cytosine-5)-methyltransferase 1